MKHLKKANINDLADPNVQIYPSVFIANADNKDEILYFKNKQNTDDNEYTFVYIATDTNKLDEVNNPIDGCKYIDLGLPSGNLWADRNLGAETPYDYGDYDWWGLTAGGKLYGETKRFDDMYWKKMYTYVDNYTSTKPIKSLDYDGTLYSDNITMYVNNNAEYYHKNRGIWRTPSKKDFEELLQYTTQECKGDDENKYVEFTSTINGNKLYIPCGGTKRYSGGAENLSGVGTTLFLRSKDAELSFDGKSIGGIYTLYYSSDSSDNNKPKIVNEGGTNGGACGANMRGILYKPYKKEYTYIDTPLNSPLTVWYTTDGLRFEQEFTSLSGSSSAPTSSIQNVKTIASLELGTSLKSIGAWSFCYCYDLESVKFSKNTTSIGYQAFYNCSKLKDIVFKTKDTIEIGNRAFTGTIIEQLIFNQDVVLNTSGASAGTFYGMAKLKNVEFNGSLLHIGDYMFNNCGIESIKLSRDLKTIGSYAFSGCTKLKSIDIPNSVTSIGSYAFQNCTSLTSINYNGTIEQWKNINRGINWCYGTNVTMITCIDGEYINASYKSTYSDGTIKYENTISNSKNLVEVEVLDSATSIGSSAFSNCSGLTSITIPDSVTSIGSSAFSNCSGLTSITIPDSVKSIGSSAFSGCTKLTSIDIPNSVTSIGDSAFNGCTSLTSINIPSSMRTIGTNYKYPVFEGCNKLTEIYYDGTESQWTSISGRYSINAVVYFNDGTNNANYKITYSDGTVKYELSTPSKYSSNLDTIEILKSYISNSEFSGFKYLKHVIIGNKVTSIGDTAFQNCTYLASVTISDSVTRIGNNAFISCASLTSIDIPNSVTSIGYNAFKLCTSLTSVTIPNSVTSMGSSVFDGCTKLTSIDIPNSVTSMSYTFSDCTSLTSVNIPTSVTSMNYTFSGCTKLTSINYDGTIEQWESITKDSNWNSNVPSTCMIHCTDGDISI